MPEGPKHIALKQVAKRMLRRLGAVDTIEEAYSNADMAGNARGVRIAFECGNSSMLKIEALRDVYDIVVHIPYCYTPKLTMPLNELERRLNNRIIAWRCES